MPRNVRILGKKYIFYKFLDIKSIKEKKRKGIEIPI
jgi:hypothetical protein